MVHTIELYLIHSAMVLELPISSWETFVLYLVQFRSSGSWPYLIGFDRDFSCLKHWELCTLMCTVKGRRAYLHGVLVSLFFFIFFSFIVYIIFKYKYLLPFVLITCVSPRFCMWTTFRLLQLIFHKASDIWSRFILSMSFDYFVIGCALICIFCLPNHFIVTRFTFLHYRVLLCDVHWKLYHLPFDLLCLPTGNH